MTIIKDLYTNKVDYAKQKNAKTKNKIQKHHGALLPVQYVCINFRKSYGIYSYFFALLNYLYTYIFIQGIDVVFIYLYTYTVY